MQKKAPFFRTGYNYDTEAVSSETALTCLDPSLTDQSQKDDVDINNIMQKFGITGHIPETAQNASYGDFTQAVDYHTAMNQIIAAQSDFMQLPADIRKEFNNDPSEIIEFLNNPENRDKAIEMGLVNGKIEAKPLNNPEVSEG